MNENKASLTALLSEADLLRFVYRLLDVFFSMPFGVQFKFLCLSSVFEFHLRIPLQFLSGFFCFLFAFVVSNVFILIVYYEVQFCIYLSVFPSLCTDQTYAFVIGKSSTLASLSLKFAENSELTHC